VRRSRELLLEKRWGEGGARKGRLQEIQPAGAAQ